MDTSVSTEHLQDLKERQRTYNSEARTAVLAMNYICHKCVILNFKLSFVVLLYNLKCIFFFFLLLDLWNSKNTARYVFKRSGHITWNTDRHTYSHQCCVIIYCSCPLACCSCCTITWSRNKSEHLATDFEVPRSRLVSTHSRCSATLCWLLVYLNMLYRLHWY